MSTSPNLYTTQQIRQIEQQIIQSECSEWDLMQQAGKAAWHTLLKNWPAIQEVIVVAGKGNNGGDGYVLARLAKTQRIKVSVLQVGDHAQLSDPASQAYQSALDADVFVQPYSAESFKSLNTAHIVIVDALLGIGMTGDVRSEYLEVIDAMNQSGLPILAMDVPSGIHPDTGKASKSTVRAQVTCTFLGLKCGLFTGQAPAYCGLVECHDLGYSQYITKLIPAAQLLVPKQVYPYLKPRFQDAHKGDFGHVLVIGGNLGMGGAARLAAEAAARTGAGLVSVATRVEYASAITAARPELMCHGITHPEALQALLNKATVLVLGAGLGQDDWAKSLFAESIKTDLPKVVDADALNLLAQCSMTSDRWILTPHPGEAARLLQCHAQDIQANRFAAISQLQQRYHGVVVLKGAGTLIKNVDAVSKVCQQGNPGMATGGMGDVLGGIIAGLLAQKLSLTMAAELGVLLHAMAADNVAEKFGQRGLLASDLLLELHQLVNIW